MRPLTQRGQEVVEELARRYGVSSGAVMALLESLIAGRGSMAQFNHPELGGLGQWSRGGMTMVGDMFNSALKAKVEGLCSELSRLLASEPLLTEPASCPSQAQSQGRPPDDPDAVGLFVASENGLADAWWPAGLGVPASTGSQNDLRYAYFPTPRRLAIERSGKLTVYDTLDHQIGGVSQQQSGDASLTFASQRGLVRVADLPVVEANEAAPAPHSPPRSRGSEVLPATPPRSDEETRSPEFGSAEPAPSRSQQAAAPTRSSDEIFAMLERLADLHSKGILSEEEFGATKAELLRRL